MKIKYLGPREAINVAPYGPHRKDEVKDYPDDFAEELLETSKQQRFEQVEVEPEEMTVRQISEELKALDIEHSPKAKKAELADLLNAARETTSEPPANEG